ncbi:hypothetical protein GF376_05025 [Candidatus Peregrinibacteria bacterium]|nr:hypothetical protein [Candidatus Peregrinibacteria bacterium]
MKNIFLKFGIITLASLSVLMISSVIYDYVEGADTPELFDQYTKNYCFDGNFTNMNANDLIKDYLESTNELFNQNIETIMTRIDEGMPPPPNLDDFNDTHFKDLCLRNQNGDYDPTCQMIAVCNDPNFPLRKASTYCMAVNATGFIPQKINLYDRGILDSKELSHLKKSYFCYHATLNEKKDDVLDSSGQRVLNEKCGKDPKYNNNPICLVKNSCNEGDYECQRQLEATIFAYNERKGITGIFGLGASVSKRVDRIDNELNRAKVVLDATLATYDQLQGAWKMHIKYVDIYQSLVIYRDKLAKIRKQTDAFPFRFIDASTTKCL